MIFRRRKQSKAVQEPESHEQTGNSESLPEDETAPAQEPQTEPEAHTDEGADPEEGVENEGSQDDRSAQDYVPEVTFDRSEGPFDIEEIADRSSYVDFESLLIPAADQLQIRLDVEGARRRIVAVTIDHDDSSLQVQAFAAPRSEALWSEIRGQIRDSVAAQGGESYQEVGTFGWEVHASVPSDSQEGAQERRSARFLGVDGPRWFLRAMLVGPAATEVEAAAPLEAIFRSLVVVRGDDPMPPRDLLPLRLPEGARPQGASEEDAQEEAEPRVPLGPVGRGPEITEVG